MAVMPDGRSVTPSNHVSASFSAWATAARSDGLTALWLPARPEIATWRARSQLTGPPDHDSSFWSSANSGILPAMSSGSLGSRSLAPNPKGRLPLIGLTVVLTNDRRPPCRGGVALAANGHRFAYRQDSWRNTRGHCGWLGRSWRRRWQPYGCGGAAGRRKCPARSGRW